MKDKGRGDFYKIIFFLCQPECSLAADRRHNATPANSAEQYHKENRRLQNAKFLLSLYSSLSLTVTAAASQFWKVKTLAVGERDFLFTQHSPVPTPGTRNFFSEPTPDTLSIPVIHETNTSLTQLRAEQATSLEGREPTSQVPGARAEPKPAPGSFRRAASPGTSGRRLCPHAGVSENVRLGTELSSHPAWGVFALEQS